MGKNIKIKYFNDKLEKLTYIDGKSDWIDLRSAEDVDLKEGEFHLVPLGVAMEIPEGYEKAELRDFEDGTLLRGRPEMSSVTSYTFDDDGEENVDEDNSDIKDEDLLKEEITEDKEELTDEL